MFGEGPLEELLLEELPLELEELLAPDPPELDAPELDELPEALLEEPELELLLELAPIGGLPAEAPPPDPPHPVSIAANSTTLEA
jgi:hypothetical protein